ncbi:uroporphyrinogen-III synthase [Flavobacterium sp. JP2137]|uniref:uroporphyrinogen-III synthase n=1 Tax=Flavobacterium sp. JP2137 TaxID=3414510 RepID=UPI003D2FD7E8
MSESPQILSTKTLTPRQKAMVSQGNLKLLEQDFISIALLEFDIDELHDYLLITSQNAVASICQHPKKSALMQKPVFCVGIKTKELLEEKGWQVLAWAHYASELAPIITRDFPDCTISFFNGNLRSAVLPDALSAAQMTCNEFQVYRTDLTSVQIDATLSGICFYSPSGVHSYLQQNQIGDEVCFCIGTTTAAALEGVTKRSVLARFPTVEATLEACVNYYK